MPLSELELEQLAQAKAALENPGLAVKFSHTLGAPIEKGFTLLPENWQLKVRDATRDALNLALKGALLTMKTGTDAPAQAASSPRWHKLASAISGGVGGAMGVGALFLELPLSTTIILRSIADIARAHGEDLSDPEVQLACLEVFALGGPRPVDDTGESAYFGVRMALAKAITEATEFMATQAMVDGSAPAIARLIGLIATRFQVQISQKAAAMAVPVIGAVGGASINLLFIDHFQDMSRGHFTVRKLERIHGTDTVRALYEQI